MRLLTVISGVAFVGLVAGCADVRTFETAPVTVQTQQGAVVCQLYTPDMLYWDRSVLRPEKMNTATADAVCRAEGVKRQGG